MSKLNVLILMIYNDVPEYREMLAIQKKYMHSHPNIHAYFVRYVETQTTNIEIIDDMICIRGVENLLNITLKTMAGLTYLMSKHNYDFIIRSNISTLINLDKLYSFLLTLPLNNVYGGGYLLQLEWIDPPCGITEITIANYNLYGIKYYQGTCILLSSDVVKRLIMQRNKINHKIVDDVSFGLFMREYLPAIYANMDKYRVSIVENIYDEHAICKRNKINHKIVDDVSFGLFMREYLPAIYANMDKYRVSIVENIYDEHAICIRNKHINREVDVSFMDSIVDKLIHKQMPCQVE